MSKHIPLIGNMQGKQISHGNTQCVTIMSYLKDGRRGIHTSHDKLFYICLHPDAAEWHRKECMVNWFSNARK